MKHLFSSLKRLNIALLLLVLLGIPTSAIAQQKNRTSGLRVEFDINRRGRPTNLEVIESSGNERFDRETLDALEKMRFERSDEGREGISADIDIEFNGLEAYEYPPDVVNSYIESCSKGEPDSYGFCVCTMEAVQKRYPLETFVEVSFDMSRGNVSPEVEDFFQFMLSSCITKLLPVEEFFPSLPAPRDDSR
ncbi:MAG: energy transducer TonB [Cyanobacteriota bacterium]|nr:energy transducer TonB [Cyanobacteriota bacterium]